MKEVIVLSDGGAEASVLQNQEPANKAVQTASEKCFNMFRFRSSHTIKFIGSMRHVAAPRVQFGQVGQESKKRQNLKQNKWQVAALLIWPDHRAWVGGGGGGVQFSADRVKLQQDVGPFSLDD